MWMQMPILCLIPLCQLEKSGRAWLLTVSGHTPASDSPFVQSGLIPALLTAQAIGRAEITGEEVLYKL